MRLSTASLLLCLFVSILFVSQPICLLLSMSLSLFICLLGCYPVPVIIFAKCLYCYFTFLFSIFINHQPSSSISFFHPSLGGEFETLSSSGMVYPYPSVVWVSRSTHYFVLFVLQKVPFVSVCFKLSLVTTTGVDACLCLSFDII